MRFPHWAIPPSYFFNGKEIPVVELHCDLGELLVNCRGLLTSLIYQPRLTRCWVSYIGLSVLLYLSLSGSCSTSLLLGLICYTILWFGDLICKSILLFLKESKGEPLSLYLMTIILTIKHSSFLLVLYDC